MLTTRTLGRGSRNLGACPPQLPEQRQTGNSRPAETLAARRCTVEFYGSRDDSYRGVTWQVLLHLELEDKESVRRLLQLCLQDASPSRCSLPQPLALAGGTDLAVGPEGRDAYWLDPLTAREIEVLRCLAEGFSNRQIADELILAEGTVKFYVHSVLEKLGVHNRTQAVVEAQRQNII